MVHNSHQYHQNEQPSLTSNNWTQKDHDVWRWKSYNKHTNMAGLNRLNISNNWTPNDNTDNNKECKTALWKLKTQKPQKCHSRTRQYFNEIE